MLWILKPGAFHKESKIPYILENNIYHSLFSIEIVHWTVSMVALSTGSFLLASIELLILAEHGLPFQALNISLNEPLLFGMYLLSLCEIFGLSKLVSFLKHLYYRRKQFK